MHLRFRSTFLLAAAALPLLPALARTSFAQTCTTQSALKPADRDALVAASNSLALAIEANDPAAIRAASIPDLQASFAPVAALVASTAPTLRGGAPQVENLFLLDASTLAKTAAGANPNADVQFFCTLNASQNEADFTIPQLPPGRYAFAMVGFNTPNPTRVSMLLQQEGTAWRLAGLYPKPLTAEGHDGLWFWSESRKLTASKDPGNLWTAWLYLQEAQALLQPAPFVSSSHLEKLTGELATANPSTIAGGLSPETPLVLKFTTAKSGPAEFRITSLAVDDPLGPGKLDIIEHIKVDSLADAVLARQRNLDAAAALLAAHPELRKSFHGVWVFADAPGAAPYGTELAMEDIPKA